MPTKTVLKIHFSKKTSKKLEGELYLCDICNTMKRADGFHWDEGAKVCGRCWPEYAKENALCPDCGTMLKPIYENNGFTEPEGPSHWEVIGHEPCAECGRVDE